MKNYSFLFLNIGPRWPLFSYLHHNSQSLIILFCALDTTRRILITWYIQERKTHALRSKDIMRITEMAYLARNYYICNFTRLAAFKGGGWFKIWTPLLRTINHAQDRLYCSCTIMVLGCTSDTPLEKDWNIASCNICPGLGSRQSRNLTVGQLVLI